MIVIAILLRDLSELVEKYGILKREGAIGAGTNYVLIGSIVSCINLKTPEFSGLQSVNISPASDHSFDIILGLKPPLGGSGVKNKEDYAPFGRVIRFGVLNKEKALPRWRVATDFIISIPYIPLGGMAY
jgi:hypothetical protein